jgi:hypothetical protein
MRVAVTTLSRMRVSLATGAFLFVSLLWLPARGNDLEPETGAFGGYAPPEPYELMLRRVLFEDDAYRLCQFAVLPSFQPEWAVYIVESDTGKATLISRTLKQEMWTSMMGEMAKVASTGSIEHDAISQSRALHKLRVATNTKRVELDAKMVSQLGAACEAVLLRVRYPTTRTIGADGTTYHVGHWVPGAFLSGKTWSPKPGTLARDYVNLGATLKKYADAKPGARPRIRAALLASADRLVRRSRSMKR